LGLSPILRLDDGQRQAVNEALSGVGLSHLQQRLPGDMSGGERQRIALARVLVRQKPILLLDEAFAALGPGLRREMLDLLRSLHDRLGLTTLMLTHAPEDARRVAEQVIFVDAGEVRKPEAISAFLISEDRAVQRYLGDWG
jgi:thiamine transport system ATP-binding protein